MTKYQENGHLFRAEAVARQTDQVYGEGVPPPSRLFTLAAASAIVVLIGLVVFLALSSFPRSMSVPGEVFFEPGVIALTSEIEGELVEAHVNNGDRVEVGSPLATVRSRAFPVSESGVDNSLTKKLSHELQLLEQQRQLELKALSVESERLKRKRNVVKAKLNELNEAYSDQQESLLIAEKSFNRFAALKAQGAVSDETSSAAAARVLAVKLGLSQLRQTLLSETESLNNVEQELDAMPAASKSVIGRYDLLLNDVQKQLIEQERRFEYRLTAPIAGSISNLRKTVGQPVYSREVVLSIIPSDSVGKIILFVEPRYAGLLTPEMPVRISYDAFPPYRYGYFAGKISQVDKVRQDNVLGKGGVPGSYFTAIVDIQDTRELPDGREVRLLAGMTLTADVLLERQSALKWLFEPLLDSSGGSP